MESLMPVEKLLIYGHKVHAIEKAAINSKKINNAICKVLYDEKLVTADIMIDKIIYIACSQMKKKLNNLCF